MKKIRKLLILILVCCSCDQQTKKKVAILLADREAPLGWVYLRIYEDKTFEFESRGLERKGKIYAGKIDLKNDTIYFHYADSVPKAGSIAIISKNTVSYSGGLYPETLGIKKNELTK